MFIYIDESGTFTHPQHNNSAYGCVGALTIPEQRHGAVFKSFKMLTRKWGCSNGEIKGCKLNECQIAEILEMLIKNNVKFHACVTDMQQNTEKVLKERKIMQAKFLFKNITEKHQQSLIQELKSLGDKVCKMSDQLFVQFNLMTQLVNSQLHDIIIYFSKVSPKELGSFRWVIDGKNSTETTYEKTWKTLLPLFIHARQLGENFDNKIILLEEGDYTFFKHFLKKVKKTPNPLTEQYSKNYQNQNVDGIDLRAILCESLSFPNSKNKLGLQLVDIVTNALRRSLIDHLQEEGWSNIGRLMFKWKDCSIQFVHLNSNISKNIPIMDPFVVSVIEKITQKASSVFKENAPTSDLIL